ncbi:Centromere protein O [Cricetulus griseus]|nr:Centromere protein O [Cricetulus griseus]
MNRPSTKSEELTVHTKESSLRTKIHELQRQRDKLRAELKRRTAFEGNLLDSYFVDLVIEKPLRIHHHSIPVFILLERIDTEHLQTDTQCFLFSLCEYLNTYSGRKYQTDQLETDFSAFLTGPLQRNALCNLLSFTYKVDQGHQTFSFSATLLYNDLTAALPTGVTVTCPGAET